MRKLLILFLLTFLMVVPSVAQETANAHVQEMAATLNLRVEPDSRSTVIKELAGGTPLIAIARTSNNRWLQVRTLDGLEGWVSADYVVLSITITTLPSVGGDVSAGGDQTGANVPSGAAPNASVNALGLNLRSAPTTTSTILVQLPNRAPLILLARTGDSRWLKVETSTGMVGWVSAAYVNLGVSIGTLPVEAGSIVVSPDLPQAPNSPTPISGVISNITSKSREIFQKGKTLGNRPNVFSKVGDSVTVSTEMFDPIGRGLYNLGSYGYLQGAIDYFSGDPNSFLRVSESAGRGWTTAIALSPAAATPSICQDGELPIVCEYRINKPAVALIMFGSNDVFYFNVDTYSANLSWITEISIEMGVIPVLSTFPTRIGYEAKVEEFNTAVRQIAVSYGVPLWDYGAVTNNLPNSGLNADGIHPSSSPAGYQGSADFNGENLLYGYVMRNLTALQVLDALWRQVLSQ